MKSIFVLSVILYLIQFTHGARMVYEFGTDSGEEVIYSKEGNIPLLTYETTIDIPVPQHIVVTYIKVTVSALSPPKVDYDNALKKVSINFTWIQLTKSSYKVVVKGQYMGHGNK